MIGFNSPGEKPRNDLMNVLRTAKRNGTHRKQVLLVLTCSFELSTCVFCISRAENSLQARSALYPPVRLQGTGSLGAVVLGAVMGVEL